MLLYVDVEEKASLQPISYRPGEQLCTEYLTVSAIQREDNSVVCGNITLSPSLSVLVRRCGKTGNFMSFFVFIHHKKLQRYIFPFLTIGV